ncbi:hypothetical protein F0344_02275 [Streptomyces finlayi]|uniref:Uncharacterized protein n=1 Tax=Streptomyces finlayi TaxID=67296 RepID=A0A7G7BE33_9ACTN|nr:hypothetical protein [Streptomyces finlayi]QNE73598.1 hypothetical protein F0344_02275 [Streptomyces finlayi]
MGRTRATRKSLPQAASVLLPALARPVSTGPVSTAGTGSPGTGRTALHGHG